MLKKITFVLLSTSLLSHADWVKSWMKTPYVGLRSGVSAAYINNVKFFHPSPTTFVIGKDRDKIPFISGYLGFVFRQWPVRIELELTHRDLATFSRDYHVGGSVNVRGKNDLKFRATSLMAQFYWDIPFDPIAFYLNPGLGITYNKGRGEQVAPANDFQSNFDQKGRREFAWSLGFGLQKDIGPCNVHVGYRYVDLGKFSTGLIQFSKDESFSAKMYANEFYLGAFYRFSL